MNPPRFSSLKLLKTSTAIAAISGLSLVSGPFASGGELVLPKPLPGHPRLLASKADWSRLREQVKTDPASARLFAFVEEQAKVALGAPPSARKMVGRRLLDASRTALQRIISLSLVYQVTGKQEYADRAIREMLAVADFTDWNPSHFLDVAEMSLAEAIGYDWLYDEIGEPDRQRIANALLEKGIKTSLEHNGWVTRTNNWNQVCHAGISAAAIAIADLQPDLAATILKRAIENVPKCAKGYAPDGVYPEGPMYWDYGTSFHVILAAALDRFCGNSFGLETLPGLGESSLYMMEVTGPTGRLFNYSDADETHELEVPAIWFGQRFQHPEWAAFGLYHVNEYMERERKNAKGLKAREGHSRLLGLALLWHNPSTMNDAEAAAKEKPPLNWLGRGTNPIVVYRSSWEDPSALYLGIKGGSPSLSHAHMDVGSFVFEADGVRWAIDLGRQDYNSLESKGVDLWNSAQGSPRWGVLRLGPESHNVLRFNGKEQLVHGNAQFVQFQGDGKLPHGVLDLTSLYSDQVKNAYRKTTFVENRAILFEDEWTAGEKPVEASWQMLTRAEITVRPGEIQLRQDGKTMTLQILEPSQAEIETRNVAELQKPVDADNPGVQRITIKTRTDAGKRGVFRIFAIPGSSGKVTPPDTRIKLGLTGDSKNSD